MTNILKFVFCSAFPCEAKKERINQDNQYIARQECYREFSMGKTTFGCILIEPEISTGIVVYFHSNAIVLGRVLHRKMAYLSTLLYKTIVAVEYPGYGLSKESPTVENFFKTVEAVTNYFQTSSYEGRNLILYGRSLGCIAASYLASIQKTVNGIIMESPITSIKHIIGFPSMFMSKQMLHSISQLDCTKYLGSVTCPKCIIYGTKDQFNRKRSNNLILKFFSNSDTILKLEGYHHNNIPYGDKHCRCLVASPHYCCFCLTAPVREPLEEVFYSTVRDFVSEMDSLEFINSTTTLQSKDKRATWSLTRRVCSLQLSVLSKEEGDIELASASSGNSKQSDTNSPKIL